MIRVFVTYRYLMIWNECKKWIWIMWRGDQFHWFSCLRCHQNKLGYERACEIVMNKLQLISLLTDKLLFMKNPYASKDSSWDAAAAPSYCTLMACSSWRTQGWRHSFKAGCCVTHTDTWSASSHLSTTYLRTTYGINPGFKQPIVDFL